MVVRQRVLHVEILAFPKDSHTHARTHLHCAQCFYYFVRGSQTRAIESRDDVAPDQEVAAGNVDLKRAAAKVGLLSRAARFDDLDKKPLASGIRSRSCTA